MIENAMDLPIDLFDTWLSDVKHVQVIPAFKRMKGGYRTKELLVTEQQ
jgi:hypothetical protein